MNIKVGSLALAAVVVSFLADPCAVHGQGTAFTYQGRLNVNGASASGAFDMTFGLYPSAGGGVLVGGLETNTAVAVSNGVFTTTLNLGNVFNGAPYWLQVGVRSNGSTGAFIALTPLQALTPTPYAITASNLTGTLQATQLAGALPPSVISGSFSNSVSFTNTGNTFSGNGAGLTGVPTPTGTNYIFAYDASIQSQGALNTYQAVTFAATGPAGGWTLNSGSFAAGQTGLYLISYHLHVQTLSNAASTAGTRVILNNATTITGAESAVTFPNSYADGIAQMDKTFIAQITAGSVLQLQWVASDSTQLIEGTLDGEFLPSATMTIMRLQ